MKFDICQNCRYNYRLKLNISPVVADICCEYCKGIKSNYEPLRPDERKQLGEGKDGEVTGSNRFALGF